MFLIVSILFMSIIGTLSHFLYDISNHNKIIGLFTAVNESTWEHIKIALTPTLLWSVIDGIMYINNPNYFEAKFLSLLIIIILMPLMYYGHKFITKKDVFLFDILSFYVVIISSQLLFNYILQLEPLNNVYKYFSCIGIFIIFACYLLLTLMPIKSFIFKDPITKKYGFNGHFDSNKK